MAQTEGKWEDVGTWEDVQQIASGVKQAIPQPDIVGRMKEYMTREPAPGERSLFGEPEILAPVSSAIRGAGRFLLPESVGELGMQVGASAIGGPLIKGAAKLLKMGGKTAQVAETAGVLGRSKDVIERLSKGNKAIKAAYETAENVKAEVPTDKVTAALKQALLEGPIDDKAAAELQKLATSDLVGNVPKAKYLDLVRTEQKISEMTGSFDNVTNAKLRNVRKAIVEATKEVDPALANANQITSHMHASDEVLRLVNRSGSAQSSKAAIENLLSKKPWVKDALGLDDPGKLETLEAVLKAGIRGEQARKILGHIGRWAGIGATGYGVTRTIGRHGYGGSD